MSSKVEVDHLALADMGSWIGDTKPSESTLDLTEIDLIDPESDVHNTCRDSTVCKSSNQRPHQSPEIATPQRQLRVFAKPRSRITSCGLCQQAYWLVEDPATTLRSAQRTHRYSRTSSSLGTKRDWDGWSTIVHCSTRDNLSAKEPSTAGERMHTNKPASPARRSVIVHQLNASNTKPANHVGAQGDRDLDVPQQRPLKHYRTLQPRPVLIF